MSDKNKDELDDATILVSKSDLDDATILVSKADLDDATILVSKADLDDATILVSKADLDDATILVSKADLDDATIFVSKSELDEATITVSGANGLEEATVTTGGFVEENTQTGDSFGNQPFTGTFTQGPNGFEATDGPIPSVPELKVEEEQDAILTVEEYVDPDKANKKFAIRKIKQESDEFQERVKNKVASGNIGNPLGDAARLMKVNEKRKKMNGLTVVSLVVVGVLLIGLTVAILVFSR
jgi:hypothetical protein